MSKLNAIHFISSDLARYPGASPIPKGTSGIYSDGSASVFNEWFQKSDDRALSVVRASKSIISMSLPVDPVSKTRQYRFDRHAGDFVNRSVPTVACFFFDFFHW